MKKAICILILSAFLAAPTYADMTSWANGEGYDVGTAHIDRTSGYYLTTYGGGEFTLSDNTAGSFSLTNYGYADVAKGVDGDSESFQTFCVETAEYTANPLEVWFSNASAETPTVAGSGSHAWVGGTGGGDSLDSTTAYLYTQFAKGTLSNYRYTDTAPDGNRAADARQLQRAIWSIEEGLILKTDGSDKKAKAWVAEATTAVASGGSWYNTWGDNSIGNVRILQMYYYNPDKGKYYEVKQDQLYLIPVPAAALLGFLGLGAAGLKLRKFA